MQMIKEHRADSGPASNIFAVNGTSGSDKGVAALIDLMGQHDLIFYKSPAQGKNRGTKGLIAHDDIVIIKLNSQWDQRGGTNTDLLKSLIQAIVAHPDGFTGEIVLADNGQAQYGAAGNGGHLDYATNNAVDQSQSVQKVADSFASHKVSAYLWDNLTTTRVGEYSGEDLNNGYVVEDCLNQKNGFMISYPKFITKYGTHISFKQGVWNVKTGKYDNEQLKFINVPVLKAHFIYGVTGCVKHYMGVVSDKLTAALGARSHQLVAKGGMGSEMVGTRFPALNVIDAIWINANPGKGPWTPYADATEVNIIAAGTDPVALDYWAAKNILMPVAKEKGYTDLSIIDPDNANGKFGQWFKLAAEEIKEGGHQAIFDESKMNVYSTKL